MTALAVLLTACSPERAVPASGADDTGVRARVGAVGCDDERLPALAGDWLVECIGGDVARATHLTTGQSASFGPVKGPVGLADGVVLGLGFDGGVWRLPGGERETIPYLPPDVVSPPAFDGAHVLLAYADHVELFTLGDAVRAHIPARPVPGEPVALVWPTGVWVERRDGLDVVTADAAGEPRVSGGGPGDQHLPAAGDGRFAWVDGGDVVIRAVEGGVDVRIPADTGFLSPPALGGGNVCWEDRGGWRGRGGRSGDTDGIDVRCLVAGAGGPGDQLHPSLGPPGLIVREGPRVRRVELPHADGEERLPAGEALAPAVDP